MKYDSLLGEVKNGLPQAQNILINLPGGADLDKLASGLALYLSLTQAGKQVSIYSPDQVKVGSSHLFGVDKIQNSLPQVGSSDYVISLEGVASADGNIPALEKLDWYPEGTNLNLVFHALPGQIFKPTNIVPKAPTENSFNLIFSFGATPQITGSTIFDFNQALNLDPNASFSEILSDIIPSLGLPLTGDIASNLLAGIFTVTENLTSPKVSPDTYLTIGNNLKAGGQKPAAQVTPQPSLGFNLNDLQPQTPVVQPVQETFTVPPVVPTEPEPGWLTPKVFKGGSLS